MKTSNRFNVKVFGLAALLGVLCVGAFGVNIAQAVVALPAAGDSFGRVVTIQPGSYVIDHTIANDTYEYFKISVQAGQLLGFKFTTPTGGDPYAGGAVCNSSGEEVEDEVIIGDSSASKTITWAPSYADAVHSILRSETGMI